MIHCPRDVAIIGIVMPREDTARFELRPPRCEIRGDRFEFVGTIEVNEVQSAILKELDCFE